VLQAQASNATVGSDKHPRAASEEAATVVAADGVNVSLVRLPQVHDQIRQGLITPAIAMFREKGACEYVGDGLNRWPAAYVVDVARLYRLVIKKAESNAKYHAVAEEGVTMRAIAEAIGRRLKIDRPRRSSSLLWLAWNVCCVRHARLERADAEKARMATNRARADRRSRKIGNPRSLTLAGKVKVTLSESRSRSSRYKAFVDLTTRGILRRSISQYNLYRREKRSPDHRPAKPAGHRIHVNHAPRLVRPASPKTTA
jgi:hypothetical protein